MSEMKSSTNGVINTDDAPPSSGNAYLEMDLLRFTTAGSVDDGKSTLIGRLLYDSKAIFEDQLEAIKQASLNRGEDGVNLALLTDGLRAEREQGITIDVAYRYFATPKRKFIVADTPGHVQYTRNMVTGASTADLAVVADELRFTGQVGQAVPRVVDARRGTQACVRLRARRRGIRQLPGERNSRCVRRHGTIRRRAHLTLPQ